MFENKKLDEWLDRRTDEALKKLDAKEAIPSEEMVILMLKAQPNHFTHLDSDLRNEIKHLREDMAKQFAATDKRFEDINKRFEAVDGRFAEAREDTNRRFAEVREDMNKRFEAVDKRFAEVREDMNKRFETMDKRFSFTQWLIGFGITLIVVMMSLYQFLQPPQ